MKTGVIYASQRPQGVIEKTDELQRRIEQESGPVKTTLDLSSFVEFSSSQRQKSVRKCSVTKEGEVVFSSQVTKQLTTGRVEFRLNKRGTIAVITPVESGGFLLRSSKKACIAYFHSTHIAKYLRERGVSLPARYTLEWDETLKSWVGRLQKDANEPETQEGEKA